MTTLISNITPNHSEPKANKKINGEFLIHSSKKTYEKIYNLNSATFSLLQDVTSNIFDHQFNNVVKIMDATYSTQEHLRNFTMKSFEYFPQNSDASDSALDHTKYDFTPNHYVEMDSVFKEDHSFKINDEKILNDEKYDFKPINMIDI